MQKRLKPHAANAMTIVGIFLALSALYFALQGLITLVVGLVLISAVIDFFDGRVARKLRTESRFGSWLDTIHDFLAFGMVPAVVLVYLHAESFLYIIAASVYVMATFLRLMRFMKLRQTNRFTGLPAPAAGVPFVLALSVALHGGHWGFAVMAIVFAGLMVAPFSFKKL